MKPSALLWVLLAFAICNSLKAKTYRLKAQTLYVRATGGSMKPADSAAYFYSNGRGSYYDENEMRYSARYSDNFLMPTTVTGWPNRLLRPMDNIDSGLLDNISFDSLVYYTTAHSITYDHFRTEGHLYNTANQNAGDFQDNWYLGNHSYLNHTIRFYESGRLSKVIWITWNSGNMDTTTVRCLFYDTAGRLVLDSVSNDANGRPVQPFIYNSYVYGTGPGYDTAIEGVYAGVSQGPAGIERIRMKTYYPDGRLQTLTQKFINDYTLVPETIVDSFGYAAGTQGYIYHLWDRSDTTGYRNQVLTVAHHFNSSGQKDSISTLTSTNGSPFYFLSAASILYDSVANPVRRNNYDNVVTGIANYELYYYEPIEPAQVTNPAFYSSISLSPNPISSALTLHYNTSILKERLHVAISNTAGQLVHSEDFIPQGAKTDMLLGDELAPGLYAITVYGSGNAVLYKGTFVKQ